jgi:hypothetical protein
LTAIPAPEAFTIFVPAAGWAVELRTTAEELDSMIAAYHEQRGRRPGVAMDPATWAIVGGLFQGGPGGWRVTSGLRVVLATAHDPGTITFFDDDHEAAPRPGLTSTRLARSRAALSRGSCA